MPGKDGPSPAAVGGPFELVDQNGRTVTEKDLEGAPSLVFFGFTHCPDVCPTALYEITPVYDALGPKADRLKSLLRHRRSRARHARAAEDLPVELRPASWR